MRPTLPMALVAALLVVPTVHAGWTSTTVHVAPYRIGDAWETSWANAWTEDGDTERHAGSVVAQVEGFGTARDAFGVEQPTTRVRYDIRSDGKVVSEQLCHLLQGGNRSVRTEVLYGTNGYGSSWKGASSGGLAGLQSTRTQLDAQPLAYFWGSCPTDVLARSAFEEGDRVPFRDVFAQYDLSGIRSDAPSTPAAATTFHGRPALEMTWRLQDVRAPGDPDTGTIRVVVADGLPGLVAGSQDVADGESGATRHYEHALVGYAPGNGAPVPLLQGATLPLRAPDARLAPAGPFDAPTGALPLAYPLADALADARERVRPFASYLDAHPDALLANAYYDRWCRAGGVDVPGFRTAETDGCWWLTVGAGASGHVAFVARGHPGTSAAPLPLETPAQVYAQDQGPTRGKRFPTRDALQPETLDAASLLAAAQREGLQRDAVESFWMGVYPGKESASRYYSVSEVSTNSPDPAAGSRSGLNVNVDGQTGAVTNVYLMGKTTEARGLLAAPGSFGLPAGRASALSALAGPAVGSGLAGGAAAATGLALLLALVKFVLIPLFTRLRRDRLLDNPVRARLYERVRAEPGLHCAALVEFAGIGEGATRHHLAQLVRHRLLVETRHEGSAFVRYYCAGEVPPDVARREAALRAGSARAVYDLLTSEPDLSLRAAAARLGMSAPSVHRTKKRLQHEGLLPAPPIVTLKR